MQTALAVLGAYLIGSVSFAIVLSRLAGMPDPRSYGSGNPGATNVLRSGRKAIAALTLLGDGGKGWLAVWLASLLVPAGVAYAALAVFLGHLFPLWHRFRGGKGVATAAGALLGLDWRIALGTIATWAIIVGFFRYSSLAALAAAAFAAAFTALFYGPGAQAACVLAIAALLVWRHKQNIRRLLAGEESRLGAKASAPPPDPSAGAP
ncbi:MAG: glycerol-3-phosphate 1-O-acyltransferase PlsY [Burkholderiales bacterium]